MIAAAMAKVCGDFSLSHPLPPYRSVMWLLVRWFACAYYAVGRLLSAFCETAVDLENSPRGPMGEGGRVGSVVVVVAYLKRRGTCCVLADLTCCIFKKSWPILCRGFAKLEAVTYAMEVSSARPTTWPMHARDPVITVG